MGESHYLERRIGRRLEFTTQLRRDDSVSVHLLRELLKRGQKWSIPSAMLDRLPSASVSAVRGIERAHAGLNRAASDVAASGAHQPATRVSFSEASRAQLARAAREADAVSGVGRSNDLPGALVDLTTARHEQAANIEVLKTHDELSSELLKLVDARR